MPGGREEREGKKAAPMVECRAQDASDFEGNGGEGLSPGRSVSLPRHLRGGRPPGTLIK